MNDDRRIQQFKQMAEADPENELGHFSLGKAYLENGQYEEAVGPFLRALELNPTLSKAYQWLGEAYEKAGMRQKAVDTVTQGIIVADGQGDRMPRDAMTKILQGWGAVIPKLKTSDLPAAMEASGDPTGFTCSRCGRPGGQLPKLPFKGPLGERVFANVCSSCWREWIGMGTKVINELGLVLSSKTGQESYDQYMIEFLQLEDR